MFARKVVNSTISAIMIFSLFFGGISPASAQEGKNPIVAARVNMPTSAVDQTKVPHYFGPYPNWANSPFTLPDVAVTITDAGTGSGATAVATVGANGAVTGITITNPGSGYSSATVDIAPVTGTGSGATASASVTTSGAVTAITVDPNSPLGGYTRPVATIGTGLPTDATATVYGGVDNITLDAAGSGYTMPTVDFDLPDAPDGVQAQGHALCVEVNCVPTAPGSPVTITGIVVDSSGSGYSTAPKVVIRDGTIFDPMPNGGSGAAATATLAVQSVVLDTFGSGYTSAPAVSILDIVDPLNPPIDRGTTATASIDFGTVTSISLISGGSGYITAGGIKKFQDGLPVLCDPRAGWTNCTDNNLGQHIPIAVPDTTTFTVANGFAADADYYVIALVQHRERMSSSLPASGTLLREYVQLQTPANASFSKGVVLMNDMPDGTSQPAMMSDGNGGMVQAIAVDDPHFLGPIIVANKDRPVRIVFYNLLPTGVKGDLFLPVDSTMMGSGMGPMAMADPQDEGLVTDMVRNPVCTDNPQDPNCYKQNRATLHLHGGTTPWISDGTAHQWITPANESTMWPQGVGVESVPDMITPASVALGVPNCNSASDGCMSFYYTNQQSARLMFYHDHAWGITRLNVYAGEAAGYVITDATEAALTGTGGALAGLGVGTPLVIQDRTFVPSAQQLAQQDPTWDAARWGSEGNLWYHHVYMPAQNPGDPSGMSAFGRWMYGPWFWPPAGTAKYQPIPNPYYNKDPKGLDGILGTPDDWQSDLVKPCNLDDPTTWQYQTDPFCEPQLIPATPNISVGMEQFNDTPLVNGTAYPTTSVEPKSYRFRILNAANDRFWNLQWYVADATGTEVALKAAEVAAAQTDPNIVPTPDTVLSPVGPSWIQIGTEGGFLPAPAVIPNQPITWITDPTRFDFGNVDKHALLLAPAERADVIVDFSKYAGKTLILYNDAPAAFPARVSSYDYYTGGPDLSPAGAPSTLPGYGPNTRTIMQVTVANSLPAPAFNLTALRNAFKHHADGSGVFESGQHPIIVGQAAYNSAYGTSFAASSWCNKPNGTITRCDGFARISEQGGDLLGFNTLKAPNAKMSIKLEPKAIHDEMNAASFDEFGRMTANLGLEAVPANPAAQNIILYPFVNPGTEFIDGTNLPSAGVKVAPISSAADGTQIWKITHNGVDTHPIHFHLFDVQVLNRVTWDNIIMPPDPNELGWKDTIRVSPLEDTIVAIRPVIPDVPFEVPNSVRTLNPMMPPDLPNSMFNNIDPYQGNPLINDITNHLVNFGWEYVYHCHILSHEEMDMMRPVSLVLPPKQPDGLGFKINAFGKLDLTWNDNSINETSFLVQRTVDGVKWDDLGTVQSPLDQPNTHGVGTYTDTTYDSGTAYQYRVVAQNTVGYGGEFPSMTAQSISTPLLVGTDVPPAAPSALTANLIPVALAQAPIKAQVKFLPALAQTGPQIQLQWTDNSMTEAGFTVERCAGVGCNNFNPIGEVGIDASTYTDTDPTIAANTSYSYRVSAQNLAGSSASNVATIVVPAAPSVQSIMRDPLAVNPTNAASVAYTVTFSTPVTGVDASDFTLITTGGIANAQITGVTGTGSTRTVTISTGTITGTGTLSLQMPDTAVITDLFGTQLTGLPFSTPQQEYLLYQTAPSVVSIVAASPNPTNAASVNYTVTFSEIVNGVDTTDFKVTTLTGNILNPYIASVTQPNLAQPIYIVNVNTDAGDGTLRLDLIDDNSIQNALTIPLGGGGAQNYTNGDIYTIDKTAPTVVSIVAASTNPTTAASVNYTVTFSENVTGVDSTDFALTVAHLTGASITGVAPSGPTTYTVTVNTGSHGGTLRLAVPSGAQIKDLAGNSLTGFASGEIYTVAPGAGITDDIDSNWIWSGNFTTLIGNGTFGGKIHTSTTRGNYAEFAFIGSQFKLIYTGNTNRARVDVYVDGTKIGSLNEYNTTRVAQMKWASKNLGAGLHIVRFVHAGQSGSVMDIDAIEVGTYQVLGAGTQDDILSSWMYSGNFTTLIGNGTFGGSIHTSTTTGDYAEVTINGSQFNLVYTGNTNRARVDVYVDGTKIATLDEYNATRVAQMSWASKNLGAGQHIVRFVHAGPSSSVMDIDAILVGTYQVLGTGMKDDILSSWMYSGSFTTQAGTGTFGGKIHTSASTGDFAEVTIVGSQFNLVYTGNTNRANVDVYIDGLNGGTLSEFNATRVPQMTWNSGYLGPGQHSVKFVHAGPSGSVMDIDAIEVLP